MTLSRHTALQSKGHTCTCAASAGVVIDTVLSEQRHDSGRATGRGWSGRCWHGCRPGDAPSASSTSSAVKRSPQCGQRPCCCFNNQITRFGLVGSRPNRMPQYTQSPSNGLASPRTLTCRVMGISPCRVSELVPSEKVIYVRPAATLRAGDTASHSSCMDGGSSPTASACGARGCPV